VKGRYAGRTMTTYGYILPGAGRLLKLATNVSNKARQRLKIIDWHKANGENQSLTARHFGINRETLREWLKRFKQQGIRGLEDRDHTPHKLRTRTTPLHLSDRIAKLKDKHPCWSKYKIAKLINYAVSASTVGRIFKDRGLINRKISKKRSKAALSPKKRFPRDILINMPGKLVQIDTKHLPKFLGTAKMYQFTAIDVLTKVRVLSVSTRITSKAAEEFLMLCIREFEFEILAIQTDNGSEFKGCFDQACRRLDITHYWIEPRSPKQNTYVERSHRTDQEEFYQQGNMRSGVEQLLPLLKAWEYTYNHVRPHQSLNYATPMEYLTKYQGLRIPTREVIALQT
jgi:putative transposase